jgi:aldose sugar dehydrogenase
MKGFVILFVALVATIFVMITHYNYFNINKIFMEPSQNDEQIEINPNYKDRIKVDLFVEGLSSPTSMTFIGNNSILVLEKDLGNVRLISNGTLQKDPIYTVKNISNEKEQGLLGIAALPNYESIEEISGKNFIFNLSTTPTKELHQYSSPIKQSSNKFIYKVYLYFTEKVYGPNTSNHSSEQYSNTMNRNRVYEYDWNGKDNGYLSNPKLLLDMPGSPGPYHNGGKMHVDNYGNLYIVIGDLVTISNTLQNYPGGKNKSISIPNNSSVIIRVTPLGESLIPKDNPFYSYYSNDASLESVKYYYSYGIRNSFGMDTDPLTGKLWNTENGENNYDEINLVQAGFNSGWYKIMGPVFRNNGTSISDLISLNGSHYSDPEFSWRLPVGLTDIEFLESSILGKDLENNIFVGDINNGNLYFFKINSNRTGIDINNSILTNGNENELKDLVADTKDELENIIFASEFNGRITDLETGVDGSLYILTYFDGRIYKVTPQK